MSASTPETPSVLITGCSKGGIGYALARAYKEKGYLVFATARRVTAMEGLAELGIQTFELDVTKPDSIKEVGNKVKDITGGRLDILVNNAGQQCPGPAVETAVEATQHVFDVNLFGTIRMVQEFVDPIIKAQGKIISIGSIAGTLVLPFAASYNATKAALQQYCDTLRMELEPYGVAVTTVITGTVWTNIFLHDPDLAPESKYWPINDQYVQHRKGDACATGATDVDVYAHWLVSKTAHKGSLPARLYKGAYSTQTWLLDTFVPRWLFSHLVGRHYGMNLLKGRLKAIGWTPDSVGTATTNGEATTDPSSSSVSPGTE